MSKSIKISKGYIFLMRAYNHQNYTQFFKIFEEKKSFLKFRLSWWIISFINILSAHSTSLNSELSATKWSSLFVSYMKKKKKPLKSVLKFLTKFLKKSNYIFRSKKFLLIFYAQESYHLFFLLLFNKLWD